MYVRFTRNSIEVKMNILPNAAQKMTARRFVMYLPDNNRYGEHIENIETWVREACLLLAKLNGGVTRLAPSQGLWFNESDNCLICETTHIVFSCVSVPEFLHKFGLVRSFLARFARETDQDSIAVEFDGTIYFLSSQTASERQLELA
jgi:hypothetical protein